MQYNILYRLTTTNHPGIIELHVIDSKLCTFCSIEILTIEHLFVDCPDVKEIWCAVEDIHIDHDKTGILFGKFYICNMQG